MTTLYAQAAGNASEIVWNTAADGSGDSAPWGDHLETDSLESNGVSVALDLATIVRAAIATANGGGFTCDLNAVGTREFAFDVLAGATQGLYFTGATYNAGVIGSIQGGVADNAWGLRWGATSALVVDGDVAGGTTTGAYGVRASAAGAATIRGTITGGTHANAPGISVEAAGIIDMMHLAAGGTGFTPGLYIAHATATLSLRGDLDLTSGVPIRYSSSATGANRLRFQRSARFKVLGPDGTTPIYFRPEAAQHFGGLVGRVA